MEAKDKVEDEEEQEARRKKMTKKKQEEEQEQIARKQRSRIRTRKRLHTVRRCTGCIGLHTLAWLLTYSWKDVRDQTSFR